MCCMGAGAFKENKLSFMGFRIIIFFFFHLMNYIVLDYLKIFNYYKYFFVAYVCITSL